MVPIWAWWALLGLHILVVLRLLASHLDLNHALRHGVLHALRPGEHLATWPSVSVVIAAQNEESALGTCLEALATQSYPALEIIVANDRSTDRTADVVRTFAARFPDVRVVDVHELPPGWLGKTHALTRAVPSARGDYLVFTDADVAWHPALLRTCVAFMEREQLAFLSLWPRVVVGSFWERLLPPACGLLLALWFHQRRPGDAAAPPFANGQFLAIRRPVYDQIGGHAAVRDEVAEDVALARLAKAAGLRRHVALGQELLRTRMYENLRQITSGWTRIFCGALAARWKLIVTTVAAVVGHWPVLAVPLVLLAVAAVGRPLGALHWAWLLTVAAHLVALFSVARRHAALFFEGRVYWWLLPLATFGAVALLLQSVLFMSGRGTLAWGRTRYRLRGTRAIAAIPATMCTQHTNNRTAS